MDDLTRDLFRYLEDPSTQPPADNTLFAALAERKSVLRLGSMWIVARHDLVTRLAGDPRCVMRLPDAWARTEHHDPAIAGIVERLMPVRPPADHARLRRMLATEFRSRVVSRLEADVREIVDELFDGVRERRECDLVADICGPLPVYTTTAMLGIPRADRDYVLSWARRLNGSIMAEFGPLGSWPGAAPAAPDDGGSSGMAEVLGYIEELVRDRRAHPGDDLVSRLSRQADSGDGTLTQDELVALVAMLFMTGIDTVGSGLANVVLALDRNPGVWERVVADPELARAAFLEATRLHPALPVAGRIAEADIPFGDTVIPAGNTVLLLYGAANLDPRVFAEPTTFDLDRAPGHQLGFGHGPHYCLGASLAIMQGETVLRRLAADAPAFELAERNPDRRSELAFHSVTELRLCFGERRPPSPVPA